MSEVPLQAYMGSARARARLYLAMDGFAVHAQPQKAPPPFHWFIPRDIACAIVRPVRRSVQGYLAHKKQNPPLGPA